LSSEVFLCHPESRFIGTKDLTQTAVLPWNVRFFAESTLSEVEGLRMTYQLALSAIRGLSTAALYIIHFESGQAFGKRESR